MKLSNYIVDPTAAYGYNPDRKSTVHASPRLSIDIPNEKSGALGEFPGVVDKKPDAFTPLNSVAGDLSAILKHCDVR